MSDAPTLLQYQPSDIDRRVPLREQVYELLRTRIIIGQLRPHQIINEVEVASELGFSRTPVREAVKRLADEGLIVVRAQNGTFVSDLGPKDIDEAYLIRTALEVESVRAAVSNATAAELDALEDTIGVHETAIRRLRFVEAIRLDDQFHRQIAEISGLLMLWRAVDISKAQMDRGRHLALPLRGAGEATIAQHRAIVEALRRHDRLRAVRAMHTHLNTSRRNTLMVLADGSSHQSTTGPTP